MYSGIGRCLKIFLYIHCMPSLDPRPPKTKDRMYLCFNDCVRMSVLMHLKFKGGGGGADPLSSHLPPPFLCHWVLI